MKGYLTSSTEVRDVLIDSKSFNRRRKVKEVYIKNYRQLFGTL